MGSTSWPMPRELRAACILAFAVLWTASTAGFAATDKAAGTKGGAAAATVVDPDSPAPPADASTSNAISGPHLQQIVVTARRRAELLQNVPVAVTAYTAQTLRQLGATNITDTLGVTPGLYFEINGLSPNQDFEQLVIRGIGANSQLEPSVGTFINGVYAPALDFDMGFLDVDHVEVLKGPQGALFGRNTEAGAVNIVLRKPDQTFRTRLSVAYDNFNTATTEGLLSGPLITDKLFGSITVKLQQGDYYVRQTGVAQIGTNPFFPGQNLVEQYDPLYNHVRSASGQRDEEIRLALRYVPSDDLEIDFSGHGSRFRGAGQAPGVRDGCKCYTVYDDEAFENDKDTYGAALSLIRKYAPATLNVTLAEESARSLAPYDYDGSSILQNNYANYYRTQAISSIEVRLTSATDSPLQWLAGLYGFHDHDFTDRFFIWSDLGLPGYLNIYTGTWNLQHTNISRPGAAAYGQVSYDFTPKLQLAVGGRYSWEKATDTALTAFVIPANGAFPYFPSTADGWPNFYSPVQSSASWSNFSPQGELRYKWRPDFMTYINIAEGFKAGSYQIAPVAPTDVYPVSPEKTINYEIGAKGDMLSHRLYVDADVFYIKLKDQQLQSVLLLGGILTSAITTASSSHSQGAELSLNARPTERLSLSANAAYTDAQFDNYLVSPAPGELVNRSGQSEPNTPRWTYFVSGAYRVPVGRYALELSANYRYVGGVYLGGGTGPSDPIIPVSGWSQLNIAAALQMHDWTVRLFANNATDRYIILNKYIPFTTPLNTFVDDMVAPPLTYGIRLTYQY